MIPRVLSDEQRTRYSRHILIPEVNEAGQLKLLESKVLLIGAGGLDWPRSLWQGSGIDTIGIVDFDAVDLSNCQRQILHGNSDSAGPR